MVDPADVEKAITPAGSYFRHASDNETGTINPSQKSEELL
jgi:hypothetical protein